MLHDMIIITFWNTHFPSLWNYSLHAFIIQLYKKIYLRLTLVLLIDLISKPKICGGRYWFLLGFFGGEGGDLADSQGLFNRKSSIRTYVVLHSCKNIGTVYLGGFIIIATSVFFSDYTVILILKQPLNLYIYLNRR